MTLTVLDKEFVAGKEEAQCYCSITPSHQASPDAESSRPQDHRATDLGPQTTKCQPNGHFSGQLT